MKVGSLVVVLPFEPPNDPRMNIIWIPKGDKKTIYTIREMVDAECGILCVRFEEGIIGYDIRCNQELAFERKGVREVQPPKVRDEILQLVNDCQLVEAF